MKLMIRLLLGSKKIVKEWESYHIVAKINIKGNYEFSSHVLASSRCIPQLSVSALLVGNVNVKCLYLLLITRACQPPFLSLPLREHLICLPWFWQISRWRNLPVRTTSRRCQWWISTNCYHWTCCLFSTTDRGLGGLWAHQVHQCTPQHHHHHIHWLKTSE